MNVIVAGMGPGKPELFTAEAESTVRGADVVLTSRRLAEVLRPLNARVEVMGVLETVDFIRRHKDEPLTVCAAASGDTGFYSIASTLEKRIGDQVELNFVCGIGSLSYFASRLKMGYEEMKLVSLHGKNKSIVPHVCYNRRVFALTGGEIKAHDIVRSLTDAGLAEVRVHIGQNLSLPEERIVSGKAGELSELRFEDLSVVVVENENYVNPYRTLKDEEFIRGKTPMTKEAVRNLSVMALEIEPDDVVYDIGAGTGSLACAMALKARESFVYAVEKDEEAIRLIAQNMDNLAIRNIRLYREEAPAGMEDFPPADKVFIGGSTGNLRSIAEQVLSRSERAVFVVTAVTLETISQTVQVFDELGLSAEITCANISRAQKLGRYNLMKADNPVYIVKGARTIEG